MRWLLIICSAIALAGCQSSGTLPAGTWEAKGEYNRYTDRFFLQVDSLHQVYFSDRRHNQYDLPVVFSNRGKQVKFAADSLYAFSGSRLTDSTFGGWLRAAEDSFAVTFYPTDEQPFPGKPQEPRPPFPYQSVEVTFASVDTSVTLAGTLTLPKGDGPFPAAVLISGSGGQDRNSELLGHKPFLVQAHHYTSQGIAVLRFDDRGVGESTGDLSVATTADLVKDVMGAVGYLLKRPDIDTSAIFLIGHSEGGIIAPIVANALPEVDGVVLLAGPAVVGEELLLEQGALLRQAMGYDAKALEENAKVQRLLFALTREGDRKGWTQEQLKTAMEKGLAALPDSTKAFLGMTEGSISIMARKTSSPWMRYFITYDPGEELKRLQVPVLALFGELDLQVPPDQNRPALEQHLTHAPTDDVTITVYPKLNHLFQTAEQGTVTEYAGLDETFNKKVLEDITNWILQHSE